MSWLQVAASAAAAIAAMRAAYERGDLDEAARRGALAGPAVVERALVSPDRTTALAGIAAATIVEDRAELLGPLARVAAGADRRTARAAAEAARAIAGELARRGPPDDLAPADLAAWQATWAELALRGDRWIDVRVPALDAAAALDPAGTGVDLEAALRDPDAAFRRAATGAVRLPVPPAAVPALAAAVAHDADPTTALDAAQSLCLSLEASADPRPILDALGAAGLTRLRALVTRPPADAPAATLRDAARCLAADHAPESAAALRRRRR
ncbi:MAG TPA: hypothetical protein VHW23_22195 [Kofleriaceae bacterium]|nr:hypothetical protein [Kofleriaceae bacterium]